MLMNPDPMTAVRIDFTPLTGALEQWLSHKTGASQVRMQWLLQSVISGLWRSGEPVELGDLTLAQFDGCVAQLYRTLYGERLLSEGICTACKVPFELSFELQEFQNRLLLDAVGFDGTHNGLITAMSGRVFRLPRVADLDALARMEPDDWLRELLHSGEFDAVALEKEIAQAGPVLCQDIDAPCPECRHVNAIRFDLASFLLSTLDGEKDFVWREVHLIARQYGWGLNEILALSRDVRRQLSGLIVSDASRLKLAS